MNNLYIEAKQVEDLDDDNRTWSSSYLECIKSYATVNEELYEKLKKELVTKVLNYRHTND
jgi:hypothetical protein